jgi:rubredoxin
LGGCGEREVGDVGGNGCGDEWVEYHRGSQHRSVLGWIYRHGVLAGRHSCDVDGGFGWDGDIDDEWECDECDECVGESLLLNEAEALADWDGYGLERSASGCGCEFGVEDGWVVVGVGVDGRWSVGADDEADGRYDHGEYSDAECESPGVVECGFGDYRGRVWDHVCGEQHGECGDDGGEYGGHELSGFGVLRGCLHAGEDWNGALEDDFGDGFGEHCGRDSTGWVVVDVGSG